MYDLSEAVTEEEFETMQNRESTLCEHYVEKYEPYMEKLYNDSILAKARKIQKHDVVAVGQMFDKWRLQERFIKEQLGTVSDLGQLPRIAYDVILGFYGGSVIPMIASTQTIKSSQGIVYFKDIRASNTRGNVTAGQNLRRADSAPDVYADPYAHSSITEVGYTVPGVPVLAANFSANAPIRKFNIKFVMSNDPTAIIQDNGEGQILSNNGVTGTVDYETGDVVFNYATLPNIGDTITWTYAQQFEADGSFPLIQPIYRNKTVNANTFVLGQKLGLFQNFEMMQTLGRNAEEDMISDLTNELMAQIATRLVRQYEAQAVGNTNFDADPGTTEEYLHRLNLKFKLSSAGNKITDQAGRGHGNVWIAGSNGATYIENLPGFELSGIHTVGSHFYGTYNKTIPVIKSPEINTNTILVLYKGEGGFDAPGVHATYMPLTVLRPDDPDNVLQKRGVAAHWGAVDTVVPNFITKVTILNPQT
jgi:hypothetical protein